MYNYREYFITVTAIFLSLAFGILVGISFGEDYLLSNQREIIELMEQELNRQQKRVLLQESELERWEKLKPLVWRAYRETLSGKCITILTVNGEKIDPELELLLRGAGAETAIIDIPAGEYLAITDELSAKMEELVQLLTGSVHLPVDDATGDDEWLQIEGEARYRIPDMFLIPVAGNGPSEARIMEKLWVSLHRGGTGVIGLLFTWQDSRELRSALREDGIGLVDNIDTVWGQVALLEMLVQDITGHYGFDSKGNRLFPPLERTECD